MNNNNKELMSQKLQGLMGELNKTKQRLDNKNNSTIKIHKDQIKKDGKEDAIHVTLKKDTSDKQTNK